MTLRPGQKPQAAKIFQAGAGSKLSVRLNLPGTEASGYSDNYLAEISEATIGGGLFLLTRMASLIVFK